MRLHTGIALFLTLSITANLSHPHHKKRHVRNSWPKLDLAHFEAKFAHLHGDGSKRKTILWAFDGFRHDFVSPVLTPFLWFLASEGTWAPFGMKSQNPTVTAPNFASISTGKYTENHGVVANIFWEPVFETYYDYWNFTGNAEWAANARQARFYNGTPIWQAYDGGREGPPRAAAMRWPTCDAEYNGRAMGKCEPYLDVILGDADKYDQWIKDIDVMTGWLTEGAGDTDFLLYYCPEPDESQHHGDIYGDSNRKKLLQLDRSVYHLFMRLVESQQLGNVDVLFLADHGFADLPAGIGPFYLGNYTHNLTWVSSGFSMFPTKNTTVKQLYTAMKAAYYREPKIELYLKSEMPEEMHYKHNRRIGDVVVVPKLGFWPYYSDGLCALDRVLCSYLYPEPPVEEESPPAAHGTHGYDNVYPEMRSLFVAYGPSFKRRHKLPRGVDLQNIDVYPLLCHLLGAQCPEGSYDGSFDRIKDVLRDV